MQNKTNLAIEATVPGCPPVMAFRHFLVADTGIRCLRGNETTNNKTPKSTHPQERLYPNTATWLRGSNSMCDRINTDNVDTKPAKLVTTGAGVVEALAPPAAAVAAVRSHAPVKAHTLIGKSAHAQRRSAQTRINFAK